MRISDWSSDVCSSDLFRFDAILEAHRRREAPADATDDAQVAREAGFQVATVIGSQSLEKLTYEEDFMRAEQRLSAALVSRTGLGFDVHRFAEGEELWLGGLLIPHDKGLSGHSDDRKRVVAGQSVSVRVDL